MSAVFFRSEQGRHLDLHTLQRLLRTDRVAPGEYIDRAIEIIDMIREGGGDPDGSTFLEIGTGWKPYLPFVLSLAGARRVITLDVNRWLRRDRKSVV